MRCICNDLSSFAAEMQVEGLTQCNLIEWSAPTQVTHVDIEDYGVDTFNQTEEERAERKSRKLDRLGQGGLNILNDIGYSSKLKPLLDQIAGHKYGMLSLVEDGASAAQPTTNSNIPSVRANQTQRKRERESLNSFKNNLSQVLFIEDTPPLHTPAQKQEFKRAIDAFIKQHKYQPLVFSITEIDSTTSDTRLMFGDLLERPEIRVIKYFISFAPLASLFG